jgi:prolycopene isomerase
VEFVPHPCLYRAIFPGHDIRVAQKDLPAYIATLTGLFPQEREGIRLLFDDMAGLTREIEKYSAAGGKIDVTRMPVDFPHLTACAGQTWGAMMDARIHDTKLRAIVSALWAYYGLPPSKLASIYYALPTFGYLVEGGYYPRGRSQTISNAFVKFIEGRGGKVLLGSRVEKILVRDGAAYGVKTAAGRQYTARVVVSNANAFDTFHKMLEPNDRLADYLARMDRFSTSLSCFSVFLGLRRDLVGKSGIQDAEIFYSPVYDPEAAYRQALDADMTGPGFAAMLYDNLYRGYSPEGKNTLSIIALQGYDHWKPYESDYRKGQKEAYRKEKERMADRLVRQVESVLLPGLAKAVEIREVGTPLTNVRYTGNYRGAIYGWDQTLDNSNPRRLPHATPIRNLYLAGAWTSPGAGYSAVVGSGLECFAQIMASWG